MVKTLRRVKYGFSGIALAAFAAMLTLKPDRYIAACSDGIKLWASCVLPSLFPFMVVCALLTNTGIAAKISQPLAKFTKIFKLPAAAAPCFLMGITSGYPAGSRVVSEFYSGGYIDGTGARKLACLCTAASPVFTIGTVGAGMFGCSAASAKLFAAHVVSVTLVAIVYSLFTPKAIGDKMKPMLKGNILRESFYGAVNAALTAGAFIVFFYTAAVVIADLQILYPLERLLCLVFGEETASAVCTGLVEMTGGCAALAKSGSVFALPFAGFLVTFGGACVLLQQLSYLSGTGVKASAFILQKFIQGALCFFILLIIQ
ncbi:MAG: hypothetical protein LUI60_05075 [Clostridia bacterium]|nr:hypothetical protein [Clostridia bacterium]